MGDWVILRIWIFDRKSRSATNSRKWSDFGLWRHKYHPLYRHILPLLVKSAKPMKSDVADADSFAESTIVHLGYTYLRAPGDERHLGVSSSNPNMPESGPQMAKSPLGGSQSETNTSRMVSRSFTKVPYHQGLGSTICSYLLLNVLLIAAICR